MSLHVKRWVLSAVLIVASGRERRALPFVLPNANIERAGVLRDTLLTVNLEARRALWRFSTTHAPMSVDAFAEAGKAPVMPGPLLRVPAGTRLRITLRNSLAVPITLLVPAALRGGADRVDAMDTILVAPGAVDSLTTRADAPGSYVYRGTLPDGASKISHIAGILAGAIVVDSVGAARRSDRVLVLMATEDSASAACDDSSSATRELALALSRLSRDAGAAADVRAVISTWRRQGCAAVPGHDMHSTRCHLPSSESSKPWRKLSLTGSYTPNPAANSQ